MRSVAGLLLLGLVNAFNVETVGDNLLPSGDMIDLISRDAENIPEPFAFGHKFITGGAGEGEQKLGDEQEFQQRQQVKSDNVLPAYCEPPNPCPVGFSSENGCLEDFDNSCAEKEASDVGESLQQLLEDNDIHNTLIAKKFHEKRSSDEIPRRKRSAAGPPQPNQKINPYLQGEVLKTVVKKSGHNLL